MTYYKLICYNEWLNAGWPPISFMELDNERYQVKLLEIHNNRIAYAYSDVKFNGCFLAEDKYESSEFFSKEKDLELIEITKSEFYCVWGKYVL